MKVLKTTLSSYPRLACLLLFLNLGIPALQAQSETEAQIKARVHEEMERMRETLAQEHIQLAHEQVLAHAMEKMEVQLRIQEQELQAMEERVQREVEQQMVGVEAEMRALEQHMQQAEAQVRAYEQALKDELVADGLIPDRDSNMHMERKDDQLFLNGKKLSPEMTQKYLRRLDAFSEQVEKAFHMPREY